MENTFKKIGLLVLIIAILSIGSFFIALVLAIGGGAGIATGNVAVIPIEGVIAFGDDPWSDGVDPDQVIAWLQDADEDPTVEVIVLAINSPGGTAVASDEISAAVRSTNKPTVAWIREAGASGAYWIASSSDHIIANRMSITGSVGVTASYLEFGGTLERYNASYQQFTGGEYKELGTIWREPTARERALYQEKIDRIHEFFLDEVTASRNLTSSEVAQVRTGEFFLGIEAMELHLVDELGGQQELDAYVKTLLDGDEPAYVYYEKPRSFIEELGLLKASFLPELQEPTGVSIRT
jgi:protease-4